MKKHAMSFLSLLIFLVHCLIYSLSEIRIPFGILNEKNDSIPLINKIANNKVYLNLTVGTPERIIKLTLEMFYDKFFLPNSKINESNSETIKVGKAIEYEHGETSRGWLCTDFLYINNTKTNINFILNNDKSYNFGGIGLLIPYEIPEGTYPFFQSLHLSKLINSLTWTIKYFKNISLIDTINGDNPIGELIFGNEPYEYEENKEIYNLDNYRSVKVHYNTGFATWELQFNDIYISTKNKIKYIQGTINGELKIEANYIIASKEYYTEINEIFFKKYISDNICKEEKVQIPINSYYISCDKEGFDYKDFPILTFEHKTLEQKFILKGNDLFIFDSKTNKYIFLIFGSIKDINSWKLGAPFLKKYQFIFNEDKKEIGHYSFNQTENENSNIRYIVIISVLILIIIAIVTTIYILIQKGIIQLPRKRRPNELEENIIYEEKVTNKNDIENINS